MRTLGYDMLFDAAASCGTWLNCVYLRRAPRDGDKIVRLRERLMVCGWEGRKVIALQCGDYVQAFTGTHRICAAQGLEGLLEVSWLPEDLTSDEFDLIDAANDDESLLAAFLEIAENRDDMGEIIETMRAELESNAE